MRVHLYRRMKRQSELTQDMNETSMEDWFNTVSRDERATPKSRAAAKRDNKSSFGALLDGTPDAIPDRKHRKTSHTYDKVISGITKWVSALNEAAKRLPSDPAARALVDEAKAASKTASACRRQMIRQPWHHEVPADMCDEAKQVQTHCKGLLKKMKPFYV